MKLSELVYNIVTTVTYFEQNNSISIRDLREYAYTLTNSGSTPDSVAIDIDYKRNVDNVFSAINEAVQRVATLEKLPVKTINLQSDEDGVIDLTNIEDFDHAVNLYVDTNNSYKSLSFVQLEPLKIKTEVKNKAVNVEYYPDVKYFTYSDIAYHYDTFSETEVDMDVDLRTIGISNKTATYIILYAQGKLGHDIYGAEANQKINQAEAYFADLDDFGGATIHYQNLIDKVYKVGWYAKDFTFHKFKNNYFK